MADKWQLAAAAALDGGRGDGCRGRLALTLTPTTRLHASSALARGGPHAPRGRTPAALPERRTVRGRSGR